MVEGVALRLRAAFVAIEKNQTEVAEFLEVGPNRINQFVKAKRLADLQLMIRLCNRYGLTLDWIYRGDPSGLKSSIADRVIEAYQAELNHPSHPHNNSRSVKKARRHAA